MVVIDRTYFNSYVLCGFLMRSDWSNPLHEATPLAKSGVVSSMGSCSGVTGGVHAVRRPHNPNVTKAPCIGISVMLISLLHIYPGGATSVNTQSRTSSSVAKAHVDSNLSAQAPSYHFV